MPTTDKDKILILDFGSQYTQLIARRVREQKVYCEIVPFNTPVKNIDKTSVKGIILSGGPSSVFAKGAPLPEKALFDFDIPILGICYGLQIIGYFFSGSVDKAERREYGHAKFFVDDDKDLFKDVKSPANVWMSHGDHLVVLPAGYTKLGHTENASIGAVANRNKNIYGIQFHPEVVHTPQGKTILRNFLYDICGCAGTWTPEQFVESTVRSIKDQVGDGKVICGLSGGVDSAVTAALINKAISDQLIPVFVDNGVLRKNEANEVRETFQYMNLQFVDASQSFLKDLKGKTDPEDKRKAIGKRFIDIFEKEAKKFGEIDFLAQGTLYPDVIESVSTFGPSVTIKSHHNVGGLPEKKR